MDEAAQHAEHEQVRGSFALRFALAFLYASGNGERWPYDHFWREVRSATPTSGRMCSRKTLSRSALLAILRNVGLEPTATILHQLRQRSPLTLDLLARRRVAEMILRGAAELDAVKEIERKYHG